MRIIRYILGSLLFLMFLGTGAATGYIFFVLKAKLPTLRVAGQLIQIADIQVTWYHVAVAITVVLFFLALLFWPPKIRAAPVRRKATRESRTMPDSMGLGKTAPAKPAQGSKQQSDDASFDQAFPTTLSREEQIESQDTSTYDRLEDPKAMARLVAIDQGEMSLEVVSELCNKYYPRLTELVNRIESDDATSLEALGRHIIGIARNRLKLTDKELSDNQFSIFQEKVFNAEKEPFLQIYLPANIGNINDAQRASLGRVVDKRAWEKAQRKIRAERNDWQDLSMENAAQLILKTNELLN